MKTVVISLGGSILIQNPEKNKIGPYLTVLKKIAEKHRLLVVVGGGGMARDYIEIVKKFGVDEGTHDEIGILVTRLNATLLVAALGDAAYPKVVESYSEAQIVSGAGRIVVMGGMAPAQSTDAVAAILAERVHADVFVNVTSIDGVYEDDPKSHPGTQRYDTLTPEKLLKIVAKGGLGAGSHNVLDIIAARVVERSKIPLVVLNGETPENLSNVLLYGKGTCSVVSATNEKILPL